MMMMKMMMMMIGTNHCQTTFYTAKNGIFRNPALDEGINSVYCLSSSECITC